MIPNLKSVFGLEVKQGWLRFILRCATATSLALGFISSYASAGAKNADLTGTIQRAVSNYKMRQLKAREYMYQVTDHISWKGRKRQVNRSELYEVIPLGKRFYRRHLEHNNQPLPPVEESTEQQKLKQAIEDMEEAFQKRVEDPYADVGLDIPKGTPLSSVMFRDPAEMWQLDLSSLPEGFSFRLLAEEISGGRKQFVVEGKPVKDFAWPQRDTLALQNFNIKLWIDREELEIVKMEARANEKGLLAKAEHATVNGNRLSSLAAQAELDALYESTLWYERNTVITEEWTKLNDEVWLPASLRVLGDEIHERDYPNSKRRRDKWPAEQETSYMGYRKFSVNHHILPEFSVVSPREPR